MKPDDRLRLQTDADVDMADLISLVDAPEFLPTRRGRRIHISTLYRKVREGKLRAYMIGGVMYTDRASLRALMTPVGRAAAPIVSDPVTDAALRAKRLL